MTALRIAQGDQGKMSVVFWMGGLSMEGSLVNIRAYKPYTLAGPTVKGLVSPSSFTNSLTTDYVCTLML